MADAPEAAGAPAEAELPEDVSSLLDEITVATGIKDREAKRIARRGVQELLANLVAAPVEKIDKALIDAYIAEIDGKLSAQIDEILHNEDVQKLESAWRGLKRGNSAPNRARSYRGPMTAMNSMPQQAVTKGYWKSEYLRPQFTLDCPNRSTALASQPSASSTRVVRTSSPRSSCSDMAIP